MWLGLVVLIPRVKPFQFSLNALHEKPLLESCFLLLATLAAWKDSATARPPTEPVRPLRPTQRFGLAIVNGQNTVTNPISGTQQFFKVSKLAGKALIRRVIQQFYQSAL